MTSSRPSSPVDFNPQYDWPSLVGLEPEKPKKSDTVVKVASSVLAPVVAASASGAMPSGFAPQKLATGDKKITHDFLDDGCEEAEGDDLDDYLKLFDVTPSESPRAQSPPLITH